jgi:hypothetical protein
MAKKKDDFLQDLQKELSTVQGYDDSDPTAYDVDDILTASLKRNKKKKAQSGPKGKRVEREVCKELITRFSKLLNDNPTWGLFSRSIGSGNRWGQKVSLSQTAVDTFSGDITVPANFKFVLESKGGYNDYDLNSAFDGGHAGIDEFINQVSEDARRSGRKPMLLWKKDRKPRLAFLPSHEVPDAFYAQLPYVMRYRDWTVCPFDEILKLPDSFFFDLP